MSLKQDYHTKKHFMLKANTKQLVSLFVLLVLSYSLKAQLNVTDSRTAQQLVQKFVGANVVVLNPQLTCPQTHNGEFQVITSNLGINEGIILASGHTKTNGNFVGADGPVGLFSSGQQQFGNTIPELNAILPSGQTSQDGCMLEFDFVPDIDTISTLRFNYVFASEEYPEFACSGFNDIFAFLLTGPGVGVNQNIALVPGTTIPVAINTINMAPTGTGYPLSTCQAMGPGSPFSAYYVDNQGINGQTITYDGFTTVLEASAIVSPCDTFHIKLAIADVGDQAYNSAVFLQANSFTVDTVALDLSGIIKSDSGYLVEGCTPAVIKAVRTVATPKKKKVCLSYGGTAINGLDYNLLPDSLVILPNDTLAFLTLNPIQDNLPEGFETVIIRRINCCTKVPIDSIEIKVRDSLKMELLSVDTGICDGATVVLHATGDEEFNYAWTPPTDVANPFDSLTTATPHQTITYTVTASFLSCPDVSRSFTVTVEPIPQVNILFEDTALCFKNPLLLPVDVQPGDFNGYSYSWSTGLGLTDSTIKQPYFFPPFPDDYVKYLTVTTPLGCAGMDSVLLFARPGLQIINVTPNFIAKYGDEAQLNAEADGALYWVWTPDKMLDYPTTRDPKVIAALDSATFMVIGMNVWGCRDTAFVHMAIDYTMKEIIPSAFSPNGDGLNDVFRVSNLVYQRLIEFRVFNRWGQEVFSTTDGKQGWDGTYKGVPQEIGVYHYLIRINTPDGQLKVYKGDVSLIR